MNRFFDWLRDVVTTLADLLWAGVALLLDLLSGLGAVTGGLLVLLAAVLLFAAARLMQRRLVRHIAADPAGRLAFTAHEIWFFLPAWLFLPFVLLWRGLKALWRWLTGFVGRRGRKAEAGGDEGRSGERRPFLAATLGPSFLIGGGITALLYLLVRLSGPLLAARLGLSPGTSVWEYLVFGHRPELASYLPLGRDLPFLAAVLGFLLWATVWWWAARLVRAVGWRHLGGSLLPRRDDPETLRSWRRWAAARHLLRPSGPYRLWAGSLLAVALPLAAWAWFTLGDVPYRVAAGDLAAALVLCLAWTVHLLLQGDEHRPETAAVTAEETSSVPGWPEVCADLEERLQISPPRPFRPARPLTGPTFAAAGALDDPLLSPLLRELIPGPGPRLADRPSAADRERRLTLLQRDELLRLSRLGHVFTRPVAARGELTLGETRPEDDEEEVRSRNRVVLAPEGAGKTTLAVLAAANHALVHTRASLLVVRDEAAAEALYERIRRRLDPSTLRWTLRLRRVGTDLQGDLTRGIVPDLVVTSLDHLTVKVLDRLDTYGPLLRNLGLVVVDDAESFAGAVETHAKLAFQRLALAARKLLGVEQLGDDAAPLVLALGCDTMYQAGTWVKALIGTEAEVETYGGDTPDAGADPAPPAGGGGRRQAFYRLHDFRSPTEERLDPVELIASCERRGVAWHYRPASDGRRHLGRASLFLGDEPEHFAPDPADAAVVLIDGSWSEVRREIRRLSSAGQRHPRTPCAVITVTDPDVEMAFTQHDEKLSLAGELEKLPRPVLRPATGRTVGRHLAADLVQSWTEVKDLLGTFGNASAHTLRELADEGLLLTERRVDVREESSDYEEKVYVRALANAVAERAEDEERAPLPPKVAQVELASERTVAVVDRTDHDHIATVDADSAGLAYYPGRVFADASGRFVVVHHARQEGGHTAGDGPGAGDPKLAEGNILVEPLLGDDVSSPRRRVWIQRVLATGHPEVKAAQRRAAGIADPAGRGESPAAALHAAEDPTSIGHSFYGPNPLRIGDHRIEVELALVDLRARHHATYLLGPTFCEVRQRRLFGGGAGGADGPWETQLTTVALCIYPNPEVTGDDRGKGDGTGARPALTLRQARLVAAAMRAVLPALYRGARENLEVGLHVTPPPGEELSPDSVLQPWDCVVLFDLHALGNGSARALYRDGVELLLRLTRLLLERVLYHDRLLALHDLWADDGDLSDLYSGWNLPAEAGEERSGGDGADGDARPSLSGRIRARRDKERLVRHQALDWLDSRLRPEGDAAAVSGSLGRSIYEAELGEGDVIDAGRCWYHRESTVADLVWAKHRWRLHDDEEIMLDVGFGHELAEEARRLGLDDPALALGRNRHAEHLTDPAFVLDDGTVWGAPGGVWRVEGEERRPHSSQAGADDPETGAYHAAAAALATYSWFHVGPLVRKLKQAADPEGRLQRTDPVDRYRLAAFLAAFVQGIPDVRPPADTPLPERLRPAVPLLLERRADRHAKALLLALLLQGCGIPAGLLLSRPEKRSLVVAALPDPVALVTPTVTVHRDSEGKFASEDDSTGEPEHYRRSTALARQMDAVLKAWSETVGLHRPPSFWSELPVRRAADGAEGPAGDGGSEDESGGEPATADSAPEADGRSWLFVPIEPNALLPPGIAALGQPESWVFLPLVSVFHSLPDHLAGGRVREERRHDEERAR